MSRTALVVALALATATLSPGCSSLQVRNDWDRAVDFARFETFALIEDEGSSINPLVERRIRGALSDALRGKGLEPAASLDEADLAVGFQVATENRRSYRTIYSDWRARGYRHGRGGWQPGTTTRTATTRVRHYIVGALVIAMFDGESRELVWEGVGARRINPSRGPEQSERQIADAIERILRAFPPG